MRKKHKKHKYSIKEFLDTFYEKKTTNLILTVGAPPTLKTFDKLEPIGKNPLSAEDTKDLAYQLLSVMPKYREIFEKNNEVDCSFGIAGVSRFRANFFYQRDAITSVFSLVPFEVPTWKEIDGPKSVLPLLHKENGLIIVTGPISCGKTTVIAALVEHININRSCHIITLDEPIEHLFRHKKSLIDQRQIGRDTTSYESALYHVLRQSPDVVVLQELQSLEMVSAAITIAEAGCLCITQLHVPSAVGAVQRIVGIFPEDTRERMKNRLAENLLFVLSPRLFPKKRGKGKITGFEVLTNNEETKKLIKMGKFVKLSKYLRPSLDAAIRKLKKSGKIV